MRNIRDFRPPPAVELGRQLRRTIALALPISLARAGLVVMLTVDTILAGQAGEQELAFFGISMSPVLIMYTVGAGLLVGALVLTAQAHGAGRLADCGRVWRLSLAVAGALGLAYATVLSGGERLLTLLGQEDAIVRGGGRVLGMWAWGLPGVMLYVATASFLEGIGRPRAAVAVSLAANLLNVLLG